MLAACADRTSVAQLTTATTKAISVVAAEINISAACAEIMMVAQ